MGDEQLGSAEGGVLVQRAALVRWLNAAIREAGERLVDEDDLVLDFYCECGCWQMVQLTLAEYDSLGSKPVCRTGHPAGTDEASPTG